MKQEWLLLFQGPIIIQSGQFLIKNNAKLKLRLYFRIRRRRRKRKRHEDNKRKKSEHKYSVWAITDFKFELHLPEGVSFFYKDLKLAIFVAQTQQKSYLLYNNVLDTWKRPAKTEMIKAHPAICCIFVYTYFSLMIF